MLDGCQSQQYTFTIKDALEKNTQRMPLPYSYLYLLKILAKTIFPNLKHPANLRSSLYIKFCLIQCIMTF